MKLLMNLVVALVVASAVAPAQSADAADPMATVPPLVYRSAFDGYRPNSEAEVGKWRETNDKVGRIGGWRAYAKEAAAPDNPASAAMAEPKR